MLVKKLVVLSGIAIGRSHNWVESIEDCGSGV